MDKKMAFLISAVFAAGFGLGELELGTVRAATPITKQTIVTAELTTAQSGPISNTLVDTLGAQIETEYGLPADTVKVATWCNETYVPNRAITLRCSDVGNAFIASVSIKYDGQYVPGEVTE